ncbi:MAG: hypothetical protein PVJ19_10550 [Desulfobacteraceae bacterium]|jgi:hypothetical protein
MIDQISKLLNLCDSEDRVMPPTIIYNERWMLRLILDWFSKQKFSDHPLSFAKDAKWYSEIILPTAFPPRFRSDPLSETYTHADGAIGHFTIGRYGKNDINLSPNAKQLVIIEAKIFSKLSKGTKNFKDYDQAAKSVACIAQIIDQTNIDISDMQSIGFYVVAPATQLEKEPTFNDCLSKSSIKTKVRSRVQAYRGEPAELQKFEWYENIFLPLIDKVAIDAVSWEDIIGHIQSIDNNFGHQLNDFYGKCIEFNQAANKKI